MDISDESGANFQRLIVDKSKNVSSLSSVGFSKVKNKAISPIVDDGDIRLHPKCQDPRITHLLFADDLLVFSDGSRHSISD
ncbi:hypothetical protein Bca4012_066802 [Brassica carinata]